MAPICIRTRCHNPATRRLVFGNSRQDEAVYCDAHLDWARAMGTKFLRGVSYEQPLPSAGTGDPRPDVTGQLHDLGPKRDHGRH